MLAWNPKKLRTYSQVCSFTKLSQTLARLMWTNLNTRNVMELQMSNWGQCSLKKGPLASVWLYRDNNSKLCKLCTLRAYIKPFKTNERARGHCEKRRGDHQQELAKEGLATRQVSGTPCGSFENAHTFQDHVTQIPCAYERIKKRMVFIDKEVWLLQTSPYRAGSNERLIKVKKWTG